MEKDDIAREIRGRIIGLNEILRLAHEKGLKISLHASQSGVTREGKFTGPTVANVTITEVIEY